MLNHNASSLSANDSSAPRATTPLGILEGLHDSESNLDLYLGVPFAQPPVGALRWKAPQPMQKWDDIREAKKFGPRPVQAPVFGDMSFRSEIMSEDCLYLNIWAPSEASEELYPVLLYFYGGGAVAGGSSERRYDGASMAKQGIVSITCNYRLNLFGYLSHPELSEEAPYHSSGNYGYLDQNAALKWVRDNIEAFGGDPSRITIAGESAGSISVSAQMASPLSRDMIAGAIGQSGAAIPPTMAPIPLSEAEQVGVEFFESAGIENLDAARSMDTDSIFDAYVNSQRFGFPGVIDGYFLPDSLINIYSSGEQAQVPLMLGWTSAEIPGMAFMQGAPYTTEAFIEKVHQTYPEDAEQVLALYPHADAQEVERSATDLAADRFIVYSTWKWFDLQRKHSEAPVYRYRFDKVRPPLKDTSLVSGLAGGTVKKSDAAPPPPPPFGASHASEIEYVLGNLYLTDEYDWKEIDQQVSDQAIGYFARFVKTGDPNGSGAANWPSASAEDPTPAVMHLDVEPQAVEAPNDKRFQFMDDYFQRK
ncbi:carboxylesterase family protein [Pelagicoccus albus]|uniref:Carboxylic ester hydrolase n=2 Tax=Pelagicoccus albus TaxID=415222 RepID=A0A7X1E6K5_9BACT|nr:carboxylesterase family protein [Pelagicoccus albus]